MTATAYLAGPDVFLPNAVAHAARKVEICRRYGLRACPPLNEDVETAAMALDVWQAIYEKDIAMMERCDIIIANLTPFGGASADAGTLIEVGWFQGQADLWIFEHLRELRAADAAAIRRRASGPRH